MKTGTKLAIFVFVAVSAAHLLRLVFGVTVMIGEWNTPQWVSIAGVVVPGIIAWLLWRESE